MTREEMLLSRATGALRDRGAARGDGAAQTRARVVRRVKLRRASRQLALVLVALAFVFVGVPGAWALATGRTPAWAEPILRVLVPDAQGADVSSVAAPGQAHRLRAHAVSPAPAPAPAPATAPAPALAPAPAPATVTATVTAPATAPAPATVAAPDVAPHPAHHSAAAPAPLDPDALYLEAHDLHFVTRDATAALAAWDRYLAAAPDGRFAIEARYNRALDLVRLGRVEAARAALAPFASGEHEGYRQREAQALLTALEAQPATP